METLCTKSTARVELLACNLVEGSRKPRKRKDPTKPRFWYPPYIGPWNQNVRSLCLCGLLGPYCRTINPGGLFMSSCSAWDCQGSASSLATFQEIQNLSRHGSCISGDLRLVHGCLCPWDSGTVPLLVESCSFQSGLTPADPLQFFAFVGAEWQGSVLMATCRAQECP